MAKQCEDCKSSTANDKVVHEDCFRGLETEYEILEKQIEILEDRGVRLDPFEQVLADLRRERLPNYAEL